LYKITPLRYFLEFSYKGTAYHGWQRQPNASTVQQQMEDALSTLLGKETAVLAAGRTDAGVHAQQKFAHVDLPIKTEEVKQHAHRLI
jgi:tRNA pseudouridine38-40 synthase